MVDILDAAKTSSQPPAGSPVPVDPFAAPEAPVPPAPPEPMEPAPSPMMPAAPAPASTPMPLTTDTLIVPHADEPKPVPADSAPKTQAPPVPPAPPDVKKQGKKKMSPKMMIVGVILLLVTIPLVALGIRYSTEIRSMATKSACDYGSAAARAAHGCGGSSGGTSGGTTGSTTVGPQPPGTYAVYANGASSGTVVGYRYIQAPGVFEGAIQRAANGSAADASLLSSQYGLSGSNLTDAAAHIAAGQTWAPPGVGGVSTWHWTTCATKGSGLSGTGCDVVKNSKNNTTTVPTPTPTPVIINTPTPTPVITDTPTPTPPPNSTPTPTPTPGPTATPTPTPTPQIVMSCNGSCTVNTDCSGGLVCYNGSCRNTSCLGSTSCTCAVAQAPQPTPKTPVSGGPTVLGASVIGIGAFILVLGLAL